jgi:C4-dicarboxylate transporter, DctQ subunit
MVLPDQPAEKRDVEDKNVFHGIVSLSERLCTISGAIAGLGVLLLVFLVVNDVMMRYVFNRPTTWGLEISQYLVLYVTLLSICYVMLLDRHVKIDMLVIHLPETVQNILALFAFSVCLVFGLTMTWITGETAASAYREWWRSNSQLMLPLFPVYLMMPIGFALFSLECICKIYVCFRKVTTGKRTS